MRRLVWILVAFALLTLWWAMERKNIIQGQIDSPDLLVSARPATAAKSELNDTGAMSSRSGLLVAADAETDPERKHEQLVAAAESVPSDVLPEAIDSLSGADDSAAAELRQQLVRRWTEQAPQSAAKWAAGLAEGRLSKEALTQVAVTWANTDLDSAIAWAKSLPEGESRQEVTVNIAYEAARAGSSTSLGLAVALPASPERDRLLSYSASQWAVKDPVAAVDWAESISDPALRQSVLAATLEAYASLDGAKAASLSAIALAPGEDQDRTVIAIIQRWAQSSPVAAADWVMRFPDTPLRQIAVQNLVLLWAGQDPVGVANWLGALPDNSLRKDGSIAYVQAIQQKAGGALPTQAALTLPSADAQSR